MFLILLKKLKFSLVILIVIFLIPKPVLAYNSQSGHPALTYEIAQFYNMNFDRKLSDKEIQLLMDGSTSEDTPPRWVNHFYNPITGNGWGADKLGNIDKKTLSQFSKWVLSNRNPLPATNWVTNSSAQSDYSRYGGDQSWYKALKYYAKGDEESAFFALGHILHLLEDMTVPEHTRSDTHAGLMGDKGSPYENYVKEITTGNIKNLDIAENAQKAGYKPVKELLIDYFLVKNAKYSHNNFFSEDTVDLSENKLDIFEVKGDYFTYVFNSDDDYPLFKYLNGSESINNFTLKDNYIMSAYFERLGRQAVISGAGAIDLFLHDAEEKRAKELKNPTVEKEVKNNTNLVFSPFGELVKITKWFDSITKFASNLLPQTAKTSNGDNLELNSDTSDSKEMESTQEVDDSINQVIIEVNEKESVQPIVLDPVQNIETKDIQNTIENLPPQLEEANINNLTIPSEVNKPHLYVSRVIDGDTVKLNNGKDVRLIGIDTPEYGEKCFDEAKKELENLVLGKEIILEKDTSETDKYNRLLRYIYIDNILINAHMLSGGFARVMTVPPDKKYYESFKMLESDAKNLHKGCLFAISDVEKIKESSIQSSNVITPSYIGSSYATVYSNSSINILEEPEEISELNTPSAKTEDETPTSTIPEADINKEVSTSTIKTSTKTVLINEVQIAGENTKDEFIELYNTTTSTVDISNWKLTKKPKPDNESKPGNESNLVSSFPNNSFISANSYFLIIPKDTTSFTATTTADTTYTAFSYSVAKDNTIILKDVDDNIIDKVGYGEASDFEESPTTNPLNYLSISRINFIDTDNNLNDFIITTSTPQGTSNTYENNAEPKEEVSDEEVVEENIIEDFSCNLPEYEDHAKENGSVNRSLANDVLTERTLAQFNSGQTVILTADNNPYYIDDTLTVRSSSKLIIEAGVIIKFGIWRQFGGNYFPVELLVQGDLEINGTADNPVIFTTFRDDEHGTSIETSDTNPIPGDWGSLRIESSVGHSISINNLNVYYGGGSVGGSNSAEGAIYLNVSGADISINNSAVYYSRSGIHSGALSQPVITNNIFSHNDLWGIFFKENSLAKIMNNDFICNGLSRESGTTGGLNVSGDVSGIILSQNNFINNQNFGLNYYTSTSSTLDASNHYWGDELGPYYSSNTSTSGNAVSDNVIFSPWSSSEY